VAEQAVIPGRPGILDLADIQGVVYNGWKDHRFAGFLFARFGTNAQRSRAWLDQVRRQVTPVSRELRPERGRLQIALSASGLERLGVPQEAREGLPQEVKEGMANRSRVLHDEPHTWTLGSPHDPLDVLVMVYAHDEPDRAAMLDHHRRALLAAGADVRDDELASELTTNEHFGFADGMSQPFLPRESKRVPPEVPRPGQETIAAGEILLGYRNAYDRLPQSPKWHDTQLDRDFDLGRNGTYLVFRKLEQDVAKFWTWLAARARELAPNDHEAMTERLGAKVMGRWKSGASLVQAPDRDDPRYADETLVNAFGYLEADPNGNRCPISSHVRRANPRDARGGSKDESADVVKRHRILRRGRSYGPRLSYEDAVAGRDDKQSRGLYFISLQASVARGFEFIQQTWLDNPGFHSLFGEADPITGGRGDYYTIPCEPLRQRLPNVPRVVTPVGGEYFLLPSLPALERIAKG
jgi:Dyp-type peroxidase family